MIRIFALIAAFVVLAPVAYATLSQATLIVAA